jgi:hypothetical protein
VNVHIKAVLGRIFSNDGCHVCEAAHVWLVVLKKDVNALQSRSSRVLKEDHRAVEGDDEVVGIRARDASCPPEYYVSK